MRSTKKYVWLCLFAVTLLIPRCCEAARGVAVRPFSPSGSEVTGDQWLFVIGIDTYIHWPRLKTAVNDAKSVRDILLSRYHFDQAHLVELYDEQATRKNILSKLRFLAEELSNDDSLLIFYAGHGQLDSITKEGSWIPVESGTKDVSAWISNHDIKNYLRVDAIKARHILLVSDSCFSGNFFRGHRGKLPVVTEEAIKRAYRLASRQAITSGGLEPVSDEGFGRNSVFSHFLVKTLEENQKPFLVPSDFFPDVKAGVAENAEQFPQFGSLKGTGGQQGGEVILFLKQGTRLKALSAEAEERKEELECLRQMEVEAEEKSKKEAEEIRKRERQLAELDEKIEQMRKRLGTAFVDNDHSLDTMLAMVEKREEQDRKLRELKRKRIEEEERRQAEIDRLKKEQEQKKLKAFKEDLSKYERIANSKFGKDMIEPAWEKLVSRWAPAAKELEVGDIEGLRLWYKNVGRLFVNATPKDARITLLNTKATFKQGMELERGEYLIEVSHFKAETKRTRVTLDVAENKRIDIRLQFEEITEIGRDGQFVAYDNGVVRDTNTGLEWTDCPDRGINWYDAKKWAENLTIDGGRWRMPTIRELGTLHTTPLLEMTGLWVWARETKSKDYAYAVNIKFGSTDLNNPWVADNRYRAFAVRSTIR